MPRPARSPDAAARAVTALVPLIALLALTSSPTSVLAYPLDGYESTGIARLLYQFRVQEGELRGRKRPSGELLPLSMVDLRMTEVPNFSLPKSDPKLTARLKELIGPDAERYGIALLDMSDPENPSYAEWHGTQRQNPGSVGKIVVALGIFQALADIHPDDVKARKHVLKTRMITADDFSVKASHSVPFFDPATNRLTKHHLKAGDTASLWTYLDWMMSPSSNSAAAMLERELIVMTHFGKDYPPSAEAEAAFFSNTSKKNLAEIFRRGIQDPVTRNGMELNSLRQGSFFTSHGKRRVPGDSSYATPRSLMQFLVKMEQGKLVDDFSSLEIKRLLYITERRIRYGSSGVLRPSAVYFKSGSLYSCQPEEGFVCKKYHGNKRNYMNSIAVIETPAGQDRLYYMVTVLSNVLKKNSAQDHRDLARAVHAMLLAKHPQKKVAKGQLPPSATYGQGFIGYQAERNEKLMKFEVQEALLALGYGIGDIDGLVGPATRKAIRAFQTSQGLKADGKVSRPLLDRMQKVAEAKGLARPTR